MPVSVTLSGIVTNTEISSESLSGVENVTLNPLVIGTKVPDEFDDKLDV